MGDKTAIEWSDATWNPVTGCTAVSDGCTNCYAESIAKRFAGTPQYPNGFAVTLRPERLELPLRWRRPRMVFVNSMSDLFHADIPDDYIAQVFAVMSVAHAHTFQVLTKRHGRMRALLNSDEFREQVGWHATRLHPYWSADDAGWPIPNLWLGVSVEDQNAANLRIPPLLATPAAVRWISAEPLLGAVDLGHHAWKLDWVVAGGESGPHARPMHPDWARSLRNQCATANVPFLFKQWGEYRPAARYDNEAGVVCVQASTGRVWRRGYPPLEEAPGGWVAMARPGKKAAGRQLDAVTWDQYPVRA